MSWYIVILTISLNVACLSFAFLSTTSDCAFWAFWTPGFTSFWHFLLSNEGDMWHEPSLRKQKKYSSCMVTYTRNSWFMVVNCRAPHNDQNFRKPVIWSSSFSYKFYWPLISRSYLHAHCHLVFSGLMQVSRALTNFFWDFGCSDWSIQSFNSAA